ncbi:Calcyclin-binding protein [Aphelenchoides besseyi]|nr:Calcyclin-binding protein [Aphelenchoides besseyi]
MLEIIAVGLLAMPIAITSTFLCKRSAAQRAIVKQSKPNVRNKKDVNRSQVPLRQQALATQAKEKPKKTIKNFFQKKKSVVPKKSASRPTFPLKKTKSEAPLHTDVTQNSTRPLTRVISKSKRKRESPKTQQPVPRAKQTSSQKSRRKKIQSDLNELQSLRTKAERSNVQKLLDNEIQRLTSELKKQSKPESRTPTQSTSTNTRGVNRPVKKLKSFAYDESDKFVKLYYTLPGVQNLPSDSINASFTEDSFNIKVVDLNGVDYTFEAAGFTHPIDASKSLAKEGDEQMKQTITKAFYESEQKKKTQGGDGDLNF